MVSRRKLLKRSLAIVTTSVLAAMSGSAMAQTAQDRITIIPASPSPVAWAYFYIAEPLGYYDEANLDVEIISNPPRGSSLPSIVTDQVQFGVVSSAGDMPDAEMRPLVNWFIGTEIFPWSLLVPTNSTIATGEDLRDKVIGLRDPNDEQPVAMLLAMAGLKPGEYKTLVTGPGVPGAVAMDRGDIAAIFGSPVDAMEVSSAGFDIKRLDFGEQATLYNGGVMASTDMLTNRRDLAVRFGRAIVKSLIWVNENQDATLDMLAKVAPEAVQDRATAKAILNRIVDKNSSRYQARYHIDGAVYQKQIALMVELGMLDAPFDANELFTNDLLDEIWDFDVDAVIAAARAGVP